ncbi:MAG: hypothetical protein KIG68_04920 [Oxalobacter sp.]|nr:hypothetical protein [Oxalobacter sp.]
MKTITETTIKEPVSMFDVIPNMKHLAAIVRESPTSESAFRELTLHGLDGEMKAGSIGTAASFLLGYASAHHTASKAERLERYKMMDEELASDVIERLEHETKGIISILDKLKADIEKARRMVSPTGNPDIQTDAFILGYLY